jgi:hypothetical protein
VVGIALVCHAVFDVDSAGSLKTGMFNCIFASYSLAMYATLSAAEI